MYDALERQKYSGFFPNVILTLFHKRFTKLISFQIPMKEVTFIFTISEPITREATTFDQFTLPWSHRREILECCFG